MFHVLKESPNISPDLCGRWPVFEKVYKGFCNFHSTCNSGDDVFDVGQDRIQQTPLGVLGYSTDARRRGIGTWIIVEEV